MPDRDRGGHIGGGHRGTPWSAQRNGILDGWLIADGDAVDTAVVDGITVGTAPLLMTDPATTARMVADACALVGVNTPAADGHDL